MLFTQTLSSLSYLPLFSRTVLISESDVTTQFVATSPSGSGLNATVTFTAGLLSFSSLYILFPHLTMIFRCIVCEHQYFHMI